MKKICAFLTILVLCLCACNNSSLDDLEIYVMDRSAITDSMNEREIVKTAKDNGRLAYDGDDIEGYNWETHTVTLKAQSVTSKGMVTSEKGGSALFKTDDKYVFVMLLKDKLIYYGGFKQGSKNPYVPLQPSIEDSGEYSFVISFNPKYSGEADCRNSKALYNFLNSNGVLAS